MTYQQPQSWQYGARLALAALAYYLAAQLGMLFVLPQANISLVWPAAGVAFALVLAWGAPAALGVGLATFGVHLQTSGDLLASIPATVGTVAAAWLARVLLRRLDFQSRLPGLRDAFLFLLLGAVLTSSVGALLGAGLMACLGQVSWQGFGSLWWVCWVADLMGILLLAPVLLTGLSSPRDLERAQLIERVVLFLAVPVAGWVIYADVLPPGVAMAKPLSYVVFPLMIWAAARLGSRTAAWLLLAHAVVAVYYTSVGHGPFAGGLLRENLLALHGHLAMLSISVLLLAAASDERRESEAKYRLLVENQTDLVVKMDAKGRALFVSPSVAELLGRPERELLGEPVDAFLDEALWRGLERPPYRTEFERALGTAQGERWIAWAAQAVRTPSGALSAVVAVGRDVTAKRAAEEQSRQHLHELAHVGRISALGEMAAGLAHELNQPLCAVTSYSQACNRLLPADADPELRAALERIAANATRAGRIISQMRAFVRKGEVDGELGSIDRIVQDVVALVGPEARRRDVKLKLALGDGLPALKVAEVQIHQVLVNLIRNAMDAIEEAGSPRREVEVRTRQVAAGVEVVVADRGPGLPAGLKDEIFEPFVTSKAGGMGLGLSISRSIIEAHDGRLEAHARVGGGTEFCFVLPIPPVPETQAG